MNQPDKLDEVLRPFNEGEAAKAAGKSKWACPYPFTTEQPEKLVENKRAMWMQGWETEGSDSSKKTELAFSKGIRSGGLHTAKVALKMMFNPRLLLPWNWKAVWSHWGLAWAMLWVGATLIMKGKKRGSE